MENENKAPKTEWRLNKIEIKFENGYSWKDKEEYSREAKKLAEKF